MFEDFRKQFEDAALAEAEAQDEPLVENTHTAGNFLGMTPPQRFIVAVMLLMMVIILGVLFLLVTAKIVPPFMA